MPNLRFLIENIGSNQDNIKTAFSKAYHLCKDAGLQQITLVFPAKGMFCTLILQHFSAHKLQKHWEKAKPSIWEITSD